MKNNKFIEIIKKKWLVNGTLTFLLMAIVIAIFILINTVTQKQNWTPIDFSQDKLYSLTDESKNKVKDIEKNINIYFIGYESEDSNLDLAKQYMNANKNINVEAVDVNSRQDLVQKYGVESGAKVIIVECGEKFKLLSENDLVTYDTTTYDTISVAEQKITSAIMNVSTDKVPKVYFLEGYSNFSLSSNMQYLNMYLSNEVNEIATLDILTKGKVPDDCDTLVITTPSKDFDEIATNAIIEYINSGRDILWLNASTAEDTNMPNVNKILELYGVKPFEKGVILETDADKIINSSNIIKPEIESADVTKDLYNTTGVIFINATKINTLSEEELENAKISKTVLARTSEHAFFRNDYTIETNNPTNGEKQETMIVGAELNKVLQEKNEETGEQEKSSKLIIYGENYFTTDLQINQNYQVGLIQLAYNKDLMLNSIAHLVDREEDVTVRKNTGTVTYTATEQQDKIVLSIIFIVPILIIILGIVVWQLRRRKK